MEVGPLSTRHRWLVSSRRRPSDIQAADQLSVGVRQVAEHADDPLRRELELYDKRLQTYRAAGVPRAGAPWLALPPATPGWQSSRPPAGINRPLEVAEVPPPSARLGLDRLLARIIETAPGRPLADHGPGRYLRTMHAIAPSSPPGDGTAGIGPRETWLRLGADTAIPHSSRSCTICGSRADLPRMSVGLQIVRGMLSFFG
jgi:hypothetical protein